MNNSYQVRLEGFEGPLDLLLHLINQYEIDIYDIPVSTITEQYMNYIHTMKELELNVASEYLVMAASLLAMKSQLLLPNQPLLQEEEMEEDPREDLMNRLIEYRKYKEAALELKEKELKTNKIYTRPPMEFEQQKSRESVEAGEISVFEMVSAMQKIMERKKWDTPLDHKIAKNDIPINVRMDEVLSQLRKKKDGMLFKELFTYPTRAHMVVTFMAVLELMKVNHVLCVQERHFEELRVFYLEGAE